ncbi:MAG: cell division/cell wall cluster transcriptional repressor MraZ [Ruminococcaceae bacterium]|nr:cell division/cell wall cluster transcriptional repressor MraZ [Oscillospiraceae bacterium]
MARDIKKIDAKGRFFIPAKQRDKLGEEVHVTNSLDKGYLCVYSKARFEKISEKIDALNKLNPKVRLLERMIVTEADEVTVDSQGRIAVSSELWERINAKPGDEICVFNNADKLEICTKSFYDSEDHDLSNIIGLETEFYVDGL